MRRAHIESKQIDAISDTGAVVAREQVPPWKDYVAYFTRRRLLVLLYGIVVSVVLAEIAIALIEPQQEVLPADLIAIDRELGFRMVPKFHGIMPMRHIPFQTNSWGLRDREFGERRQGTLRIYLLGDSMVFGYGVRVEDTLTRALEKILAQRLGMEVEVVNGGVPGYGTIQENEFFEQTVDEVRPDFVVVAVALLNDLADNRKFVARTEFRRQPRGPIWKTLRWFRSRSQLYLMIRRYRAAMSGEQMMQIHAVSPKGAAARGLRITEEALQRFAESAARHDVGFAVVIDPLQRQVSELVWKQTLASYNLSPDAYVAEQPNRRLLSFAQQSGIPMLDLLPVLRAHQDEDLYFQDHWQPRGHTLVAEAIADFLMQNAALQTAAAQARSHGRLATNGNE